jgi:hypothetical protein
MPIGKAKKGDNLKGGQVFIVPSTRDKITDLSRGIIPDELQIFNDQYMVPWLKKLPNGLQKLNGWIYDPPNGEKIKFKKTEIIRIFQPNPYQILGGMAQQIAAMVAIDQDAMADVFNSSVFENDGRITGLLTSDKDGFTLADAKQWYKMWATAHSGPANKGKTAVLGDGLKYQQYGQSLADMQYTDQKRLNKEQIISVFGLNRIAIGDYEDINFATIKEGRRLLWEDTYMPLDALIWDAINNQFISYIDGGTLEGYSDTSELEVLQQDKSKKVESLAKLTSQAGYPPELAAKTVGIYISEDDLKRWPTLSEPLPKGAQMPPADEGSKQVKAIKKDVNDTDRPLGEDIRLSVYIKQVLDPAEKSFKKIMDRYFVSQRNRTQDLVDNWLDGVKSVKQITKAVPINIEIFMLDAEVETKKLIELYTPEARKQMELEQKQLEKELGKLIEWNVTDQNVERFVKQRAKQLRSLNTLTFKMQRKEVLAVIGKSIEENWTPQQTAREIKTAIGDVYKARRSNVNTIARTEMGTIASLSRDEAFRAEGIEKWQWLTAADDLVRTGEHSHKSLNLQVQNVGEAFERFGNKTKLQYPRDPDADAGDVINCRCVVVAVE